MTSTEWEYLSASRVDSAGRVSIPDAVFDKDILQKPDESTLADGWWAYEETSGVLVLSNERFQDQSFNVIGRRKIGGESDNYRITVPRPFFEKSTDEAVRTAAQKVPDIAQITPHAELHFLTRGEMVSSAPRSVYLLSVKKLERMLGGHDDVQAISELTPGSISI